MNENEDGAPRSKAPQQAGDRSLAPIEADKPSCIGPHQKGASDSAKNGRKYSKYNPLNFLKRLSVNEWLTLLVGIGSLVISYFTYLNATDTKDIKGAVSNLSTLATQSRRQADAVSGQVALLAQQVEEARKQTKAISEQTGAIKASSSAAVRAAGAQMSSARAQTKMADVTARAQLPEAALTELSAIGLNSAPNKDGRVTFTLNWAIGNVGGSALKAKSMKHGLTFARDIPNQMPTPRGFTDGADLIIPNSVDRTFTANAPLQYVIDVKMRDAIVNGTINIFFYGMFRFEDSLGVTHEKCFGRQIIVKGVVGDSIDSVPAGGASYQCQT